MRFKTLLAIAAGVTFIVVSAATAMADEALPAEYAGLTNPFPWDDTDAREAGKAIYGKSCRGCHGADGRSVSSYDFSTEAYGRRLEEQADTVYWVFSEGRLDAGMPGYKSSITDEARWQVMTYMWALSNAPEAAGGIARPPDPGGAMMLSGLAPAKAGEPFTVEAFLMDSRFDPYADVTVRFYIKTEFFMDGWMEIGEAVTDADGVAVAELTTRLSGDTEIAARYGNVESVKPISIGEPDGLFYRAEAGLHLPAPGDEVFFGPPSAVEPSETGEAPTTAFRLPGGVLSWVLLLVAAVGLSWGTYLRVMFQVYRIPTNPGGDTNETKVLPLVGMVGLAVVGVLLMLMLLTGPQSNFHLMN